MRKVFTWDEYRKYMEDKLGKKYVDNYYSTLFNEDKWPLYVFRYKILVMPVMKRLAPDIDHKAVWEKHKDDFTKELILYCWAVSKYRTSIEHHLGYRDEDVEHLVYDILTADGIKCKLI